MIVERQQQQQQHTRPAERPGTTELIDPGVISFEIRVLLSKLPHHQRRGIQKSSAARLHALRFCGTQFFWALDALVPTCFSELDHCLLDLHLDRGSHHRKR